MLVKFGLYFCRFQKFKTIERKLNIMQQTFVLFLKQHMTPDVEPLATL